VTTVHPYVMLNYLGKPRDVMTLAHELGHGVHQVLAAGQGELLSSTPLTLAETASVFGEMLTFRTLLDQATTPAERKTLPEAAAPSPAEASAKVALSPAASSLAVAGRASTWLRRAWPLSATSATVRPYLSMV
jgi:hypothetical protein